MVLDKNFCSVLFSDTSKPDKRLVNVEALLKIMYLNIRGKFLFIKVLKMVISYKKLFTNVRLQLHGAIYRPDSFVMMLRYCSNLKAIRYESMSLNRIAADKSHHVIVALTGLLRNLRPSLFWRALAGSGRTGDWASYSLLPRNLVSEW